MLKRVRFDLIRVLLDKRSGHRIRERIVNGVNHEADEFLTQMTVA